MCRFTDIFVRFKSTELFKDTKHVFMKFSTVKRKKKSQDSKLYQMFLLKI